MTNTGPTKRSRGIHLLLRGFATVVAFVVVVLVVYFIWLNNEIDRPHQEAVEMSRRLAKTVDRELKALAEDGHVTDQEIVDTLRQHQSELRSLERRIDQTVFVAAMYGSSSGPLSTVDGTLCFEFTLSNPTTSDGITHNELQTCPQSTTT